MLKRVILPNKKPAAISFAVAIVLLIVLLVVNYQWLGENSKPYKNRVQAAFAKDTLTRMDLVKMEEMGVDLCAYERLDSELVENQSKKRSDQVAVCQYTGKVSLLPVVLKAGKMPRKSTECLIDTLTSEVLYHTANGCGNKLWYGNQEYTVTGIMKSEEPLLVTQKNIILKGEKEKQKSILREDTYDRIVLKGKASTIRKVKKQYEHDIMQITSYEECYKIAQYMRMAPIWLVLFLFLLKYEWNVFHKMKIKRKWKMGMGCAGLLLGAVVCIGTKFHFYLPEILIPDRWSRLEFYSAILKEIRSALLHYVQMVNFGFEGRILWIGLILILLFLFILLVLCYLLVHPSFFGNHLTEYKKSANL